MAARGGVKPPSPLYFILQTSPLTSEFSIQHSEFLPVRHARSPTPGLLIGLVLTLVAVVAYTVYINRQLASLRELQTDLVDRNRRDSLQLLRIQVARQRGDERS